MKLARNLLAAAFFAYLVGNEERITLAQDFCSAQERLCAAECTTPVTHSTCAALCTSACGEGATVRTQNDGCGNPAFYCGATEALRTRYCSCNPPAPQCTAQGGSCTSGSQCCSGVCGEFSGICGDMSPILIGLENSSPNYHLTSAANGVLFDIDANGSTDQVSWTEAGSAVGFLVLDRNGNLVVDDGSELFGNATWLSTGARASHGFEALADFDDNSDRKINSLDSVYPSLRLWVDLNHDGVSQPAELKTLTSAGVTTIFTNYRTTPRVDRNGNKYAYRGKALVIRNGHERQRVVFDVILVVAN